MPEGIGTTFYYPTLTQPVLFIHSEEAVKVFYNPTYETMLDIEDRFGVLADDIQEFIGKMPPDSHTLMIDVEAYLKAKEPSETDILNEKLEKALQENDALRLELRRMERSTRADILRRIARQLTEEADQVKVLPDDA